MSALSSVRLASTYHEAVMPANRDIFCGRDMMHFH